MVAVEPKIPTISQILMVNTYKIWSYHCEIWKLLKMIFKMHFKIISDVLTKSKFQNSAKPDFKIALCDDTAMGMLIHLMLCM